MDRFEMLFNRAEGILWGFIALAVAFKAFRHSGKKRRILLIAACAFGLFGVSDWIEAETGSWWDPPWLLVWKGACLFTLIASLKAWLNVARQDQVKNAASQDVR